MIKAKLNAVEIVLAMQAFHPLNPHDASKHQFASLENDFIS